MLTPPRWAASLASIGESRAPRRAVAVSVRDAPAPDTAEPQAPLDRAPLDVANVVLAGQRTGVGLQLIDNRPEQAGPACGVPFWSGAEIRHPLWSICGTQRL
jgi:hypothetical protein